MCGKTFENIVHCVVLENNLLSTPFPFNLCFQMNVSAIKTTGSIATPLWMRCLSIKGLTPAVCCRYPLIYLGEEWVKQHSNVTNQGSLEPPTL